MGLHGEAYIELERKLVEEREGLLVKALLWVVFTKVEVEVRMIASLTAEVRRRIDNRGRRGTCREQKGKGKEGGVGCRRQGKGGRLFKQAHRTTGTSKHRRRLDWTRVNLRMVVAAEGFMRLPKEAWSKL